MKAWGRNKHGRTGACTKALLLLMACIMAFGLVQPESAPGKTTFHAEKPHLEKFYEPQSCIGAEQSVTRELPPVYRQVYSETASDSLLVPGGGDLSGIELSKNTKSGVPRIKENFAQWFNDLTPDQLDRLLQNKKIARDIGRRIRYPGKMHEWSKVSQVSTFKRWGMSMEDIWSTRSFTKHTGGINPNWTHGGIGSGIAHHEIDDIIESSINFPMFKRRMRNWANYRLTGGIYDLPAGLQ